MIRRTRSICALCPPAPRGRAPRVHEIHSAIRVLPTPYLVILMLSLHSTVPYGFTHTRRHTRQDSVSGVKPESEDTRETYTCGVCVSVCVGGWPWCVVAQQWHKLEAAPRAGDVFSLTRGGWGIRLLFFSLRLCL